MCDLSSVMPTSGSPAASSASPGAPTSGTATCCPAASIFHNRRVRRNDYFGFDDKTDMAASRGAEYAAGTPTSAPTDRMTRDGAAWVSVQAGQTTKIKIAFTSNVGCARNCTFEVRPSSRATVLSARITGNNADFEIQGGSAGDGTIAVVCNGNDIGWVHVAVYNALTFRVGMCKINQTITSGTGAAATTSLALPSPAMNISQYQSFMTDCWRDAVTNVQLVSLADYSVPASIASLIAGGGFWDANGTMGSTHYSANHGTVRGITDRIHAAIRRANPGYDKYLYLMPQPGRRAAGQRYVNGYAAGIGGAYAVFFNLDSGRYSTAAHEFGHMVNLRHPNDPRATSQFPTHLRAPSTRDATNNVPPNDNFNLMGYGSPRPQRKRLRYKQWEAVSGR